MTDSVLYGFDFRAKRARAEAELIALSQAMAPDEVFVDEAAIRNACLTGEPISIDIVARDALRKRRAPDKDSA